MVLELVSAQPLFSDDFMPEDKLFLPCKLPKQATPSQVDISVHGNLGQSSYWHQ